MNSIRINPPAFSTRAPRSADFFGGLAYKLIRLALPTQTSTVSADQPNAWSDQFSVASLDEGIARRRVDALYRGGSVRL